MTLHKEGRYIIPISLLICSILCSASVLFIGNKLLILGITLPSLIILGLIINFFRNPAVNPPTDENLILSPCDGKVVVIEEVENPEGMLGKHLQVSIFMSPLNVHVNRMPWGGTILRQEYRPGKYLVAWNPKSSAENEQTFFIVSKNGVQIGFKQIAGALARRICWYVKEGDILKSGDEFGFIRFGSRMDVIMPASTQLQVSLGQVVQGGSTILGKI
jgi:phosphatidylserine decarboxylase